jgi:hypothetical protein
MMSATLCRWLSSARETRPPLSANGPIRFPEPIPLVHFCPYHDSPGAITATGPSRPVASSPVRPCSRLSRSPLLPVGIPSPQTPTACGSLLSRGHCARRLAPCPPLVLPNAAQSAALPDGSLLPGLGGSRESGELSSQAESKQRTDSLWVAERFAGFARLADRKEAVSPGAGSGPTAMQTARLKVVAA